PMDATAAAPRAQGLDLADNYRARAFGTAIHRCLEALTYRSHIPKVCDAALSDLLRSTLRNAGADSEALPDLQAEGKQMLDRVLSDPWAQWMLSGERPQRAAELALTQLGEEGAVQVVLDYMFVDEARGERWVVDYKTSAPRDGQSLEQFFASQLEAYGPQLSGYVDALTARFSEPVRCALYFTALGRHLEWRHIA
ncbi:MAG: PD-(D/E)XK nuclease family protein, partial [Congregibacter sp.]|nr:PD-(D/E)XK nuclease family protein [Congregibacter sp.]